MKNLFLFILIGFLPFSIFPQYTISGYVKDAGSGEALIGASVYIENQKIGVATNIYGFFSLSAKEEKCDIKIFQNDTPLHNQIMTHRIAMIPINIPNFSKINIDDFLRFLNGYIF